MAWTVETVAALPTDRVKTLRENAARREDDFVTALCDAELAKRSPIRKKRLPDNLLGSR